MSYVRGEVWCSSVAGEIVRLKFRVRILLTWSWRCGCGDGGEEIGDVVFLFINTIVNVVVGISWDLLCHEMVNLVLNEESSYFGQLE